MTKAFNESQPRDPRGSSTGGQWSSEQLDAIESAARKSAGALPRRTGLTSKDEHLYNLYKSMDPNNGADFGPRKQMAWTRDAPADEFYHVSREGLSVDKQSSMTNEIGKALYVGQDPHALANFYGTLQGYDDYQIYKFKVSELNPMDMREWNVAQRITKAAKKMFPNSATFLGDYARVMMYDSIRYFDPLATGDEWAILDMSKVTSTTTVK